MEGFIVLSVISPAERDGRISLQFLQLREERERRGPGGIQNMKGSVEDQEESRIYDGCSVPREGHHVVELSFFPLDTPRCKRKERCSNKMKNLLDHKITALFKPT